jgi:hypothetical protein
MHIRQSATHHLISLFHLISKRLFNIHQLLQLLDADWLHLEEARPTRAPRGRDAPGAIATGDRAAPGLLLLVSMRGQRGGSICTLLLRVGIGFDVCWLVIGGGCGGGAVCCGWGREGRGHGGELHGVVWLGRSSERGGGFVASHSSPLLVAPSIVQV